MINLIKVHDARLIPKKLIEQCNRYNSEDFYRTMKESWNFPNDFLYALLDEDHDIKGYIWYQVNLMDSSIFINTISICDEWKNKGKVEEIGDLIKKDMRAMNLKLVFFLTDKPAFYEKLGLEKTGEILLKGDIGKWAQQKQHKE